MQRWRNPVPGYDAVSPRRRLTLALVYAGLAAALIATLPVGGELGNAP